MCLDPPEQPFEERRTGLGSGHCWRSAAGSLLVALNQLPYSWQVSASFSFHGTAAGKLWQRSLPAFEEDIMALRKLGKDPESPSGGSPTIYLDEEKDSYLVQGWKVEDIERLGQMDIPGHESVVETPGAWCSSSWR
jgi:hypothetical protein